MRELKEKHVRILLVACAVVILALSITVACMTLKNRTLRTADAEVSRALASAQQANESLKAEEAEKESSFADQMEKQSESYSREKESLQKNIADLNKQLAIKRAAATANPSAVKPSPTPLPPGKVPNLSSKTIYLTFDDGPSPRTPEILKILKDNGVKATFFVINGGKNNHYMKDIVEQGHTIALHTYTHNYSSVYASDDAYFSDLQKISDLVYQQTGVRSTILRFPGGSSNTVSRKYCKGIMSRVTKEVEKRGYTYMDWNLSSGDASPNPVSANTIINNCRNVPKSNTVVVLMHDAAAKHSTVEALPQVIAYYRAAGCTFAAMDSSTPAVHQRVQN